MHHLTRPIQMELRVQPLEHRDHTQNQERLDQVTHPTLTVAVSPSLHEKVLVLCLVNR